MCGIVGIIGEQRGEESILAKTMLEKIKHRGPDHQQCHSFKYATLGSARLSVVDKNSESNQPFISKSKNTVVVFNGEIFNYKELSTKFDLYLKTKSDTEVIVELYEKIGVESFNYLEGMFSICLIDLKSNISYI